MTREDFERRLKNADPAASLTPLSDDRLYRLKEFAMTNQTSTATARPSRKTLVTSLAAGLVAVAAVGVALAAVSLQSGPTIALSYPDAGSSAAGTSLKCAEVTPELLSTASLAFAATVASIDDGVVTLDVTDQFVGEPVGDVTTQQGNPEISDGASPVFEVGEKYLVSSDGATIFSCGASAPETPELRAVYDAAFAD